MFSDSELVIIWFALRMEQQKQEEGSARWWKYERMIVKIEEKTGAKKRTYLKTVK